MESLKKLRETKDISQQKLADTVGVSRSTIAMWETGASEPDLEMLKKLANYFNVSIDYLLGVTNDGDEINTARETLKKISSERNTNLKDFKEKTGVDFLTFRAWLNKRNNYFNSAENLLKLADYFDVSLDYLLTGKETSPSVIEELENVISYSRDGKTVRKQLSKKQIEAIHTIIETMKESDEDL